MGMKRTLVAVAGLVLVLPVLAAFGIPGATATSEEMFVEVAHAEGCANDLGDSGSDGYTDACSDGGNVNVVVAPRVVTCDDASWSWWKGLWRNIVWTVTGHYFC